MAIPRKILTPTDIWIDPDAAYNAAVTIVAGSEPHELHPAQRAAHFALRYEGEINNGGHLQYFENLSRGPLGTDLVPDTIAGLDELGAPTYAGILSRAYARWLSAARLPFADLQEFSAMCQEGEFRDLDDEFYALDKPASTERLWNLIHDNVMSNSSLYVELAAPVTANDHLLPALGNPFVQPDGGRSIWLKLLDNDDPRVRARAAIPLSLTDPALAEPVLARLAESPVKLPFLLEWKVSDCLERLRSERDSRL